MLRRSFQPLSSFSLRAPFAIVLRAVSTTSKTSFQVPRRMCSSVLKRAYAIVSESLRIRIHTILMSGTLSHRRPM
ncbi:uncharacterized protein [Blastocystis hominis]|uniref:Uncharacterized protein n=1 Tax=Blastocystis hominis TaxID=12968 RepID=D8LYN5_BLAHO|nr:uncharacterized protein [Blastocystis hominis]CBK20690.2 unnamed protein product [Blastocystis hominis]|eukprot:XP_012894738.1 uncharacterized protein [Blastocystis hominis]